jgi:hypothetical protein
MVQNPVGRWGVVIFERGPQIGLPLFRGLQMPPIQESRQKHEEKNTNPYEISHGPFI